MRVQKQFNILGAGLGAGAARIQTFGACADSASIPTLRGMPFHLIGIKESTSDRNTRACAFIYHPSYE